MIKKLVGLIVALVVLLVLTLTNPGLKSHKRVVREKASSLLDKRLMYLTDSISSDRLKGEAGTALKKSMVDDLLKNGISRTDFVIFSTTNLNYKGQTGVTGYGILSNVFLNTKVDEAVMVMAMD